LVKLHHPDSVAKYIHDGADEALSALRHAVTHLTHLMTLEAIDNIAKVLKEHGVDDHGAAAPSSAVPQEAPHRPQGGRWP